jgi:hypothetical protein
MSYTAFSNIVCHKAQKAAKAMYQDAIDGSVLDLIDRESVFAGMEAGTVTSTRVVCLCRKADHAVEEMYLGLWSAELDIQVIAPAADYPTDDDFHELCGGIFAHFFQSPDDVCTQLTNSTVGFTAIDVKPRSQSWDIEADTWTSTLSVTVKCTGTAITT